MQASRTGITVDVPQIKKSTFSATLQSRAFSICVPNRTKIPVAFTQMLPLKSESTYVNVSNLSYTLLCIGNMSVFSDYSQIEVQNQNPTKLDPKKLHLAVYSTRNCNEMD